MKIAHLHLADGYNNPYTLVCSLVDESIKYKFYSGYGSSGIPNSLRNIQFYDIVNGNMKWLDKSLPLENYEDESIQEFRSRIIQMLNNSTHPVVKEIKTQVTFTN